MRKHSEAGIAPRRNAGVCATAPLLRIRGIVKQNGQLYASVAELREIGLGRIAGVQVGRGVVWWEQYQSVEERHESAGIVRFEGRKGVSCGFRLAPMAKDHVVQSGAAPVMAVGAGGAYPPECAGQEQGSHTPIPVSFVEVLAEVVALEVREDVLDHKRILQGQLQVREPAAVVHVLVKSRRSGEQTVEKAETILCASRVYRIIDGLHVGNPPIMVDREVGYVALGATGLRKEGAAVVSSAVLDVVSRLKVVQQVELEEIDDRRIDLIPVPAVGLRRGTDGVLGAIQNHSRGRYHAAPGAGSEQVRVGRSFQSHFIVQSTHDELAHGDGGAFGKKRLHPQIGVYSGYLRGVEGTV